MITDNGPIRGRLGIWLWNSLRRVVLLRSSLYLLIETKRGLLDSAQSNQRLVNIAYRKPDPWGDNTEIGREYFARAVAMLDAERNGAGFGAALDIGCAEGAFTEMLVSRCRSVLGVDLSPVAISRATNRKAWGSTVRFQTFDLRSKPIPGQFDLIVASGVLEYFNGPLVLLRARANLIEGLKPGGYLQIGTTRANPAIENSWWGRCLNRGSWINMFIARHPALEIVSNHCAISYQLTLYRKSC